MKNLISPKIIILFLIPFLTFIACEKRIQNKFNFELAKKILNNNHGFCKMITISDNSGENSLTLRMSCSDSAILNEYIYGDWQLMIMSNNDPGVNAALVDDYQFVSKKNSARATMRIEIIKKTMSSEVTGFYIQKKYNLSNPLKIVDPVTIESEFISEFEIFGGYVQFCLPELKPTNNIWIQAETLDDPSVAPKIGNIDLSKQIPYYSIRFSDPTGSTHLWRVFIRHSLSTFPIVYWVGENNSSYQNP